MVRRRVRIGQDLYHPDFWYFLSLTFSAKLEDTTCDLSKKELSPVVGEQFIVAQR